MPQLRLTLLGYPAAEVDGRPVAIAEHKALALLAYLAVTGTRHGREALAALLWPEHDRAAGLTNLRHALWALRRAGLGDWLEGGRPAIGLRPDCETDVADFRAALAAGDDAVAALHRGTFLAGLEVAGGREFEAWRRDLADELRRALAGALERLIAAQAGRGEDAAALTNARRWLALDSLHEPAHRALMRLHASAGRPGAALRQYWECARLLEAELGARPEAETTALHDAIARRSPWPTGPGMDPSPAPSPPPRPARTPDASPVPAPAAPRHGLPTVLTDLIGRERELAALAGILPTTRLLTLTGAGGVGKTRLALALAERALGDHPDGAWVVELAALGDPALVARAVASAQRRLASHARGADWRVCPSPPCATGRQPRPTWPPGESPASGRGRRQARAARVAG